MSKFFINRPIVAMVIAILMVIIGLVSMLALPVAQFPSIVPPDIMVSATYPGADAQTLEQSVATPLEAQISGVDNMNYMYSINANNGSSQITVDFDVKTDPNIDQVLTQLRTSQAQAQLPALVNTAGLLVQKSLSAPLLLVALYSPNGSYDAGSRVLHPRRNPPAEGRKLPASCPWCVAGGGRRPFHLARAWGSSLEVQWPATDTIRRDDQEVEVRSA